MKHKKKNYNLGGLVQQGVGILGDALLPNIGQVLSPLVGAMIQKDQILQAEQDRINDLDSSINPYQYKLGGSLDAATYEGASHEDGGIPVNKNGIPAFDGELEVEGNEVKYTKGNEDYIFSNFLDAQEGMTFADKAREIEKKFPKRDFNDIDRESFYYEMDRLKDMQEVINSQIEQDFDTYKNGGYLDRNLYVKDGKSTRRGLAANVYLKNKKQFGGTLNPYAGEAMYNAAQAATLGNAVFNPMSSLGEGVVNSTQPQESDFTDKILSALGSDYAPAAIGQAFESLTNLSLLSKGIDKEENRFNPYEQDVRRLMDQEVDLTQAQNNVRSQFNVGLDATKNTRSANVRNAFVQNLVNLSQGNLADVALDESFKNIQLDQQKAQTLNNLGQQRVQNQVYTDDIRARNRAVYDNEISKFAQDIADAGLGITTYKTNKSANKLNFDILNKKYPEFGISSDVFDKYMAGKYDEINPDDLVVLKRLHQSNVNLFNNGK